MIREILIFQTLLKRIQCQVPQKNPKYSLTDLQTEMLKGITLEVIKFVPIFNAGIVETRTNVDSVMSAPVERPR